MKPLKLFIYISTFSAVIISSCKHDIDKEDEIEYKLAASGYPEDIAEIFIRKCATAGCHNATSKDAAAGLNLETWEDLFKGGNGGAVIIPYRQDLSTLMYYINHDNILSVPALLPTMPVNALALSSDELKAIENWVIEGAPDKSGFVKFSDNPMRKKYYITNQSCDLVYIFDAATDLAMRAVNVGNSPATENPHSVKVSADNLSWYVCFAAGSYFQQYSTIDNTLINQYNIGQGSWNAFAMTEDYAYVTDFSTSRVAVINFPASSVAIKQPFVNPHGTYIKDDGNLYITAQNGSYLFKIPQNDFINFEIVDLQQTMPNNTVPELQGHEIIFTPDESKYFVTCQQSNEVRVYDASNDQILAVIPVDEFPQEMAVSTTHPYLFVTCMDAPTGTTMRGSVKVIDYLTHQVIKTIYPGQRPHGIAVNDAANKVYVSNRNDSPGGPAPHHQSNCGTGNNGTYVIIDMTTLDVIPGSSTELSIDPYSIGITH